MKIIALDIGGTSIKAGEIINGSLNACAEYETNALQGGEFVMRRAIEIIEQQNGFDAIGISTAGQVDSQQGVIRYANENIPEYTGTPIQDILQKRFKVPVAVENDVNCAALGEAHYGASKDWNDFLCITYGTGVGGAIVINRQIYHGSMFSAAEFGHIITHANGRPCNCGFKGCYECYASTSALVRSALALNLQLVNGRAIFEQIANPMVKSIIDDWIEEVLLGLVSLVHIFNPSGIILGGGIMNEKYIIHKLQSSLYSSIMPSYHNVVLRQAKLGNHAGIMGANYLAANILENSPF